VIPPTTRATCGSCKKPIAPGAECRTFRDHHRRCIERAMALARESAYEVSAPAHDAA
jgi:hypothetical protein